MTKADISQNIHVKTGFTKNESAQLLDAVLEIIKSTLAAGENIKINGFGTFSVKKKLARRGRNPQTGDTLILPARKVISYRPSHLIRQTINR